MLVNVLTWPTVCQDVDVDKVDLDQAVGYALKRAATALRGAMDAQLREHQLTVPQYACLELLTHRPGQTNAELARGAFVSRQAMHQLLAGLRTAGLVDDDGQGRRARFTITGRGSKRLSDASATVADIEERMLAPLTPTDRRQLHANLTQCVDALEQVRATTPTP